MTCMCACVCMNESRRSCPLNALKFSCCFIAVSQLFSFALDYVKIAVCVRVCMRVCVRVCHARRYAQESVVVKVRPAPIAHKSYQEDLTCT